MVLGEWVDVKAVFKECPLNLESNLSSCGRFCFYQWDGELVNKASFGPFVYWFGFLYSHLSKICGILFAFFTLQGLATQLTSRPEGNKKSRK